MTSTFYTIVGFTFLLTFLLAFYGLAVGNNDIQNQMNQITGPWPTLSAGSCDKTVLCLNQIVNILFSGLNIIGAGLFKLGAVLFLFYGIFTVLNGVSGTPFLGWLFGFLLFIVAVESFLVVRSGHLSA